MRMLNVNEKFDTEQSEFNENKVIWKKVKGEGKKCEKIQNKKKDSSCG